jgi:hypothetical protein
MVYYDMTWAMCMLDCLGLLTNILLMDLLSKFKQYQVHASDMGTSKRRSLIIVAVGRGSTPFTMDPRGECMI